MSCSWQLTDGSFCWSNINIEFCILEDTFYNAYDIFRMFSGEFFYESPYGTFVSMISYLVQQIDQGICALGPLNFADLVCQLCFSIKWCWLILWFLNVIGSILHISLIHFQYIMNKFSSSHLSNSISI